MSSKEIRAKVHKVHIFHCMSVFCHSHVAPSLSHYRSISISIRVYHTIRAIMFSFFFFFLFLQQLFMDYCFHLNVCCCCCCWTYYALRWKCDREEKKCHANCHFLFCFVICCLVVPREIHWNWFFVFVIIAHNAIYFIWILF